MVADQKSSPHRWEFRARFRRHSFGWRSRPAILRVRQAVAEIRREARRDPVLGAEGAVILLERISPALEQVDSSSGAIGIAVAHAVSELVPIIAAAPAAGPVREAWLDRLWTAYEADEIPYIETLGEHWGELCASAGLASTWADCLVGITRQALAPGPGPHAFYPGSSACLSALYRAGRYQEIIDIVGPHRLWDYSRWAALALAALGRGWEAVRYAEACRGQWTPDSDVDRVCEEILLSMGMADEAYRLYGLGANRCSTYLATFRAVVRKYPNLTPPEILADLVARTPGEEGKWFAAARQVASPAAALALASRSPCDPRTLARAARDWVDQYPDVAMEAGLLALHWLAEGHGHDISSTDVRAAYASAMAGAKRQGADEVLRGRVRQLLAEEGPYSLLRAALGPELDR